MYNKSLGVYKKNSLEAELSVADPHKVIQLLMQGFLERVAQAKGAIERSDYQLKSDRISSANAILNGLKDSLDMSQGEISERLFSLYEYMGERLLDASVKMEVSPLDESMKLMLMIKESWDKIPDQEKQKAYTMRQSLGDL
ncbi:flagellar export chaperone FliS [Aeromonas caviae]|uniref:flagellar export chaperone FliS n=1 Tax=Aeromonas TaxID=642 RepID=UPI00058A53F2|nr:MULTISPECIES: flagellar export chaperone FliS [Aeromonas]PZR01211.1 MAG: flagellar export chaperone FliS [Aeromonas media]AUT41204.1 flagellar export chaperone FliS [Aeromonas sp. ASNIH5]MCF3098398.1 flagellar export chaperone FliS [Aeromonas australiensis]MCF5908828.1 flagellar export chaperone FliS [Aeromonas veronii]OCW47709.1 flagellar export chaperone FliS [Aeromonas caviae]